MSRPVRKLWNSYRLEVLPKDASEVQVRETRRAFYAGAAGTLERIFTGLDPDAEPTAGDLRLMDEVYADLEAFQKAVGTPAESEWDAGPS